MNVYRTVSTLGVQNDSKGDPKDMHKTCPLHLSGAFFLSLHHWGNSIHSCESKRRSGSTDPWSGSGSQNRNGKAPLSVSGCPPVCCVFVFLSSTACPIIIPWHGGSPIFLMGFFFPPSAPPPSLPPRESETGPRGTLPRGGQVGYNDPRSGQLTEAVRPTWFADSARLGFVRKKWFKTWC